QVDQDLTELLAVAADDDARRRLDRDRDLCRGEPRDERPDRVPREVAEIDWIGGVLLAPGKPEEVPHVALDTLELGEDERSRLDVRGRRRVALHELGEAPRRGDRVADLVRDARRDLPDRGELLGVRERALDQDGVLEERRGVEHERELSRERLERR